jgi:precorrin-4 methylase
VRGQELNPPYRQDARRRAGLRAFAKAHRAIQAEEIRVARSTGVPALRAARSAFGNDLTMAVQSKINLL